MDYRKYGLVSNQRACNILWMGLEVNISDIPGKKQISVDSDILRIHVICQNYRYAQKTQISLDPKKYRYVGDAQRFRAAKKPLVYSRNSTQLYRLV